MPTSGDPFDLERFVLAQDEGGVYERALEELRAGHKRSHWMWFVFPQLAGLGSSAMSQRYAIRSLEEAQAYLRHDILGPRLRECATAVVDAGDRSADDIFGPVDAQKLHSSMTLFHRADPADGVFAAVLASHFDGALDPRTQAGLGG